MYLHNAIDIAAVKGTPVYAVESGYVKAFFTIFDSDTHWRVAIADSANEAECDGWLYAHVEKNTVAVYPGQYVEAGDSIGIIVGGWPLPETVEHLHLAKIRFAGDEDAWTNGFYDYVFTGNPLDFLDSTTDIDYPFFDNAVGSQKFSFHDDIADTLHHEGEPVSGYVDILCRAVDYCYNYSFKTVPFMLEYKIEGDSSIPWTTSFIFNEAVGSYNNGWMATYRSIVYYGYYSTGYETPQLYFYMTNSDGDGIVEVSDTNYCWETPYFHNGEYVVYGRATDYAGNSTVDSMVVTVANAFELFGTITIEGSMSDPAGTIVTVVHDGISDTTDESGHYSIPDAGGGMQQIIVHRPGFTSFDTTFLMIQANQVDAHLLLDYICGDPDLSGAVNLLDITYLIKYLYKDGDGPKPVESGDADGSGGINLLDITYLINYLYKDGPDPVCS